jgi:hypothetical protein
VHCSRAFDERAARPEALLASLVGRLSAEHDGLEPLAPHRLHLLEAAMKEPVRIRVVPKKRGRTRDVRQGRRVRRPEPELCVGVGCGLAQTPALGWSPRVCRNSPR